MLINYPKSHANVIWNTAKASTCEKPCFVTWIEKSSVKNNLCIIQPASWSSGNAVASGAGSLRLKSRAGQIGHSVANVSPPLQLFFEWSCVAQCNYAEMGPANSLHASAQYSEYTEGFDFKILFQCLTHLLLKFPRKYLCFSGAYKIHCYVWINLRWDFIDRCR